jgi:AraC-like DNA-binding protein
LSPDRITQVGDVDYLHGRFQRLAEVYRSYQPFRDIQVNTIAREIILILAEHWRRPVGPDISTRMQAMLHHIRSNLTMRLNRQTLARQFSLSPEHINLLFRKELGMTPSEVINRERALYAYRLLHEQGRSVKEAAYEAGYSDPLYFSRVFKRLFGVPPSEIATRSTRS